MIDKSKKYRTRDGREVRIYATDGYPSRTIHGAIKLEDGWEIVAWRSDGRLGGYQETGSDLIEVKPRIKREVWANLYHGYTHSFESKYDAESGRHPTCIACVCLTIDCEEGEGL